MIPLKDNVPSQTVPVVTMALVTLNVLVFCYPLSLQMGADPGAQRAAEDFVREFGVMPSRLTSTRGRAAACLDHGLSIGLSVRAGVDAGHVRLLLALLPPPARGPAGAVDPPTIPLGLPEPRDHGWRGGGVAFFAHIGGFLVGMAALFVLKHRGSRRL
jgi:membrane associated rhomboid family serine protease